MGFHINFNQKIRLLYRTKTVEMNLTLYASKYNLDVKVLIQKLNKFSGVDIWSYRSVLTQEHIEMFASLNWSDEEIKFRKIPEGITGKKLALLKIPSISKRPLNIYSIDKYFDDLGIYYDFKISFSKAVKYTFLSAMNCGLSDIEDFNQAAMLKSLKTLSTKCVSYVLQKTKENKIVIEETFYNEITDLICDYIDFEMPLDIDCSKANFKIYVEYFYPGIHSSEKIYSIPFKKCYEYLNLNKGKVKTANQLVHLFYGENPINLTKQEIVNTLKNLGGRVNEKELLQGRYSIIDFYSAIMFTIEDKQEKSGRLNNLYEERPKLFKPDKASSIWAISTPMGNKS